MKGSNEKKRKYNNYVILESDFTDEDFAEFFVEKYIQNFICLHGKKDHIYYYADNAHRWIKGNENLLYTFLGKTTYQDLRTMLDSKYKYKVHTKKHAFISKKLLKLRNWSSKTGIVKSIIPEITKNTDIFDLKPHLIGFNNGIYDLNANTLRNGKRDDFVSKSTGYDYIEQNDKDVAFLFEFINKIMPVKEERDVLLKALASGLFGQKHHFFILVGKGGNGKNTLVSKLFKSTLGRDYFEYISVMTKRRTKGWLCKEMGILNKKRTVVWDQTTRNLIPIKELTIDGDNRLMETCFMLCHNIPNIHTMERVSTNVLVIPFRSLFTIAEDIEKMNNTENVYEENRYFDSDEFRNAYKMTLFHILVIYFNFWKKENFLFKNLPQSIQDLNRTFVLRDGTVDDCLEENDIVLQWINDNAETGNHKTPRAMLYKNFNTWCVENAVDIKTAKEFYSLLKMNKFIIGTGGRRIVRGLQLKNH